MPRMDRPIVHAEIRQNCSNRLITTADIVGHPRGLEHGVSFMSQRGKDGSNGTGTGTVVGNWYMRGAEAPL